MSEEALMGDQVYQPDGSEVQDDIGPLEPSDTLDDRGVASALDEGYATPDRPLAVERYGTTANEQRLGESLDRRLAAELPEVAAPEGDGIGDTYGTDAEPLDPEAGEARTGRLVSPDGARSEQIAQDHGICGGAATAEEAAMHTVDDPEAEHLA
ncbi:DUF5709 domain-containing protein [Kitasatospora sp. NBC_01287]|uniref:DUF5709 domain-containing protein n=1 Tax=Kitasatospora sp. NBC_01287 TaxID=2903573 RepID=UPI00224CE2B9|nr:DUF5709 domain-containing protein [Kitasatospora sp. NBC_01287]MCX4751652.1 DUF5709 domain-containing protein [Kitasatospora sp. NBC_01287]